MIFAPMPTNVPEFACETVSGRYVDVITPNVNDICITDIAWSLSRQARYAGHTLGEPYSVAQHACLVETLLDYVLSADADDSMTASFNQWMDDRQFGTAPFQDTLRLRLQGLGHDNTEAYLVDLPSPVKRYGPLGDQYKKLESNLQVAISTALAVPHPNDMEWAAIDWADKMALQIEAANLMPSRGRGWSGTLPYFEMHMIEWMPKILGWKEAYNQFLSKYGELKDLSTPR